MPKIMINKSFVINQGEILPSPLEPDQNVISSMMGGKMRASVELLTAPTNEITAPRFGTADARQTVNNNNSSESFCITWHQK